MTHTDAQAAAESRPSRLGVVIKAMTRVRKCAVGDADTEKCRKAVHALRVASRRAGAELRSCEGCVPEKPAKQLRKVLRALRREAGEVRNADVHAELLGALKGVSGDHAAIDAMLKDIGRDRGEAWKRLSRLVSRGERERAEQLSARVLRAMEEPGTARKAREAAAQLIGSLVAEATRTVQHAATDASQLHRLRIVLKRIRYTAELLLVGQGAEGPLAWLVEAQRRLGDANDVATLVERLREVEARVGGTATATNTAAGVLRQRFEALEAKRLAGAAQWLAGADVDAQLKEVVTAVSGGVEKVGVIPEAERAPDTPRVASEAAQSNLFLAGERVGVIDVGSNGIRLLAVELIDDRSWNVLAEERATARLAEGQGKSKTLCTEAMARAVEAIHRFKLRCDSLRCVVRAFATAAVRDASNRADFVSLVKDRTGLDLAIVSALEEGKYTYAAVARRYDLSHGLCAVVDIGGGSLEVVLSRDGVIIQNTSMPLGAVRLTEAFGGHEAAAGERFKEMQRHIDRQLAEHVPMQDVHGAPSVVVGCGGTFTTMLTLGAAMRGVLIERNSPALRTLGPVTRPQLKEAVERLRGMTLAERLRVPGLPPDRADIVVAGFAVVERLMKHLGISQIHANPGGVREGLLVSLIREKVSENDPHASRDDRLVASARAFAERCRYERDHSEQVAALAMRLYDGCVRRAPLVPRLNTEPHERALLEAAGVLHDVGIMVEYARHHKHSATIVRHAELPGWDARLQEVLAQVCRYHRRSAPAGKHKAFAALPERDRALVRRLAGILRVADGLDRSHACVVRDVRVSADEAGLRVEAAAETDATTEVRAAQSKADVLESVVGQTVTVGQAVAQSAAGEAGNGVVVVRRQAAGMSSNGVAHARAE